MKTIEEIIQSAPVFLNNWSNSTDVFRDFDIPVDPEVNILFASYGYKNYSGDAFVLFSMEGKLYEAGGSHCSCYGLEGQWSPEEVVLKELQTRLENDFGKDDYAGNLFNKELKQFLGI